MKIDKQKQAVLLAINAQWQAKYAEIDNLEQRLIDAKQQEKELYKSLRNAECDAQLPNIYGDEIAVPRTDDLYRHMADSEKLVIVAYAMHCPIKNEWTADVEEVVKQDDKNAYGFGMCESYNYEHGFATSKAALEYANKFLHEHYSHLKSVKNESEQS